MQQPQGFIDKKYPNHVCKLQKSLYGLKQDPRAWFSRLSTFLISQNFIQSKSDSSLFINTESDIFLYVLVYVDNILFTRNSENCVSKLINTLGAEFSLKDLRPLHYFLGAEVERNNIGLILSQKQYIKNLLVRASMTSCKPQPMPISPSQKLTTNDT